MCNVLVRGGEAGVGNQRLTRFAEVIISRNQGLQGIDIEDQWIFMTICDLSIDEWFIKDTEAGAMRVSHHV